MRNRKRILLLAAALLAVAFWRLDRPAKSDGELEMARYKRVPGIVRELLDRGGASFSASEQRTLRDAVQQFQIGFTSPSVDLPQARGLCPQCENAMARVLTILDGAGLTQRIWLEAAKPIAQRIEPRWPTGGGVVILRLGVPGSEFDVVPEFLAKEFDLARASTGELQIPSARTVYAVVYLEGAAPGAHTFALKVLAAGREVAQLEILPRVPASGELKVSFTDAATGTPTAAVVGLYAADKRIMVPPQAISFDEAGFSYQKGQARPYNVRYWAGDASQRRAFFVEGGFSLKLPEGDYTLIAGKGPEYEPVVQNIRMASGGAVERNVALKRWIDMAARGWISGDAHVHYARSGDASNHALMTWSRAEDVRIANVVRMGDALKTYFEQYAYGPAGRYLKNDFALVPGQEDPRTNYIGHTLHMNIQAPFRAPKRYYLYDLVFDEMRRQRAISTYVHTYQPAMFSFFVRLDMSLNIIKGKVDGLEICEFGDIDDTLYNEFLNLGIKLAATAGSDVPWGNSVGQSRMYAYTSGRRDPDAWYEAVKAGRTFVTAGPMLELWVNGKPPGTEIEAAPGDVLEVRATASSRLVPPRYLDVIAQGDAVRSISARADSSEPLELQFRMTVGESTWLAARCAHAHTTPVYIRVNGKPFWKLRAVPELVQKRLKNLNQMEEWLKVGPGPGGEGNYCIPPGGFAAGVPELRARIEEARRLYADLAAKARQEMAAVPAR
jgi:hypothetical protein